MHLALLERLTVMISFLNIVVLAGAFSVQMHYIAANALWPHLKSEMQATVNRKGLDVLICFKNCKVPIVP